jgi:hypothetical protein
LLPSSLDLDPAIAQRIDLVGQKLLLSLFFLLLDLSVAKRILVIGGDWVAHPSNTAARRILLTYPLLAAVSGEGSPKPPSIRMNKPMESLLQLFRHTWASFCFPLLLQEVGFFKGYVSTVKPRIFIENPNPCTIAIVPGSVAIAYRTSHR